MANKVNIGAVPMKKVKRFEEAVRRSMKGKASGDEVSAARQDLFKYMGSLQTKIKSLKK